MSIALCEWPTRTGGSSPLVSPYVLIDDVNTIRVSGALCSRALMMFFVPSTFTLNVRSRSLSLFGGSIAAR